MGAAEGDGVADAAGSVAVGVLGVAVETRSAVGIPAKRVATFVATASGVLEAGAGRGKLHPLSRSAAIDRIRMSEA